MKYKYNILNLDCPNCARRIEDGLKKINDLKNVSINFNTKKLTFTSDKNYSINEINKIIQDIDSDTYIEDDKISNKEYHLEIIFISIILIILSLIIKNSIIKEIIIIIVYLILLYKPFINATKSLIKNHSINENMLITISCIGAYFIDKKIEGIVVVLLYIIGKILEEKAVNKTRGEINNLLDIKVDYANLKEKDNIKKININDVKIGDILVIKKGEKVPVDGIIIKGNSSFDTSILTGESELVNLNKGEKVLASYLNTGDVIEIKASERYEESTISKILDLLNNATDKKANMETLVSKIGRIYTPIVLILAIISIICLTLFTDLGFSNSLYRGLSFLVISCPCAILISIPLSYFTGIGIASKKGILIKGSNYLDNISKIKNIIFDKTGTLTNGSFSVNDIVIYDKKYKKEELIELICCGENLSNHPIAKAIIKLSKKKINSSKVSDFHEIDGVGISYKIGDLLIKIGNDKVCNDCNYLENIHVNINNKHVASIIINDGIKENAKEVINYLKNNNIKTYMFTGDKKDISLEIGKRLDIDEIKYELLPDTKYNELKGIKEACLTAFVGDGVNDTLSIKEADIGLSMGNIGSASSIEISDIVLVNDDLIKIKEVIEISKFTNKIIIENLIFSLIVKLLILILSLLGITNMWMAVFADTGLTLLTILNTFRIILKKY